MPACSNKMGLRADWQQEKMFDSWAVAKLVRHQALDLAFEGSNPSRPAKFKPLSLEGLIEYAKRK